MAYYRIKQINDNQFIPQTRKWYDMWGGIDREKNYEWFGSQFQQQYCAVNTLEEAEQIIDEYKIYLNKMKKYPKYHPCKP
jgi:hypothetical protein